ncbi:hydrolase [Novosphingobium sp. MBES04]|nr:hydrolase [Novosphingobium sp. MBES04]
MTEIRFHEMADGRRIAHRFAPGQGPTLVFLPGYMSDMSGSKATALFEMAVHTGRACLLVDYSGCGASDGDFADGTLSRWRDEVVAVIEAAALDKVVLIGSSMGGWLMLMVADALPDKVHSMIGIAAAPDFTDWGIAQMDKGLLADGETIYEDNPYGPEPTPTHPAFWADAGEPPAGSTDRVLRSGASPPRPARRGRAFRPFAALVRNAAFRRCAGDFHQGRRPPPFARDRYRGSHAHRGRPASGP